MKLTLAEPKYLKDSISIISDLVTEAKFSITKNSVELVAMDPANVAMVIFKLLSSAFVEYDVKKDMELAINLLNLKQVLSRAKPSDMVTLEADEKGKFTVILKGKHSRTFSLPIIDLEDKHQKVPDLEFPVSIKMASSNLSDSIEDVDVVGESVMFHLDKGNFSVSSEGELSHAKIDIAQDDDTQIVSDVKEAVKAKYSIEYLKKMIKGAKLSPEVFVQFNKDYPLKIEFKTIDKVMLSFILAPRVDND